MDIKISEFPLLGVEVATNAVMPIVQNNTNYTLGISVSSLPNKVVVRDSMGGVRVSSVNWKNSSLEYDGKLQIDSLSDDQNWILPDQSGKIVVADPITNNIDVTGNIRVRGLLEFISHSAADAALFGQVGTFYNLIGNRTVYSMPNPFS